MHTTTEQFWPLCSTHTEERGALVFNITLGLHVLKPVPTLREPREVELFKQRDPTTNRIPTIQLASQAPNPAHIDRSRVLNNLLDMDLDIKMISRIQGHIQCISSECPRRCCSGIHINFRQAERALVAACRKNMLIRGDIYCGIFLSARSNNCRPYDGILSQSPTSPMLMEDVVLEWLAAPVLK
jgi:hypothetical protein